MILIRKQTVRNSSSLRLELIGFETLSIVCGTLTVVSVTWSVALGGWEEQAESTHPLA